jgi:phosphoglycolate phosphatase-like HAD superfamily hydrolase
MIGDDIDADMNGAKQALGCTTILKTNGSKPKADALQNVDVTFDAFGDLSALLQDNE